MARILVIDDEPFFGSLMRAMLEREGHLVSLAGNGQEAALLLDSSSFDLVFSDIMMPDRAAVTTLLQLQRNGNEVPVIAMSGLCDQSDEFLDAAEKLGSRRNLAKPFTRTQLLQTTQEVLDEFWGTSAPSEHREVPAHGRE